MNYDDLNVASYPEGKPVTAFEKRVAALDQQSFPAKMFARVDDILVYALFATKRRANGYRGIKPGRAFLEEDALISKEDGIKIRQLYGEYMGKGPEGSKGIADVCAALVENFPGIFSKEEMPVLKQ